MSSPCPKEARWDPSRVMGSNCLFNLVTGMRGVGKTYAMKKIAVKRYIERGEAWVYMRYNEVMVKNILRSPNPFLGYLVVNEEFPDYTFKNEGPRMYVAQKSKHLKWELFGSIVPLIAFDSYKGTTAPTTTLMVLDEFIKEKEKRNVPYPPGVVSAFYNIHETFDRREGRVKFVGLANTANIVNPFFQAWRIKPIPKGTGKKFPVGKTKVYYENAWTQAYEEWARSSELGALTFGTEYDDYAVGNEFTGQTGLFVAPRPKQSRCDTCIVWEGSRFGVWVARNYMEIHIDDKPARDVGSIVLTREDMMPNYLMIERANPYLKWLVKAYQFGQMTFRNDVVRETFLEMLSMCGLK